MLPLVAMYESQVAIKSHVQIKTKNKEKPWQTGNKSTSIKSKQSTDECTTQIIHGIR